MLNWFYCCRIKGFVFKWKSSTHPVRMCEFIQLCGKFNYIKLTQKKQQDRKLKFKKTGNI